jgi:hypothetical protein
LITLVDFFARMSTARTGWFDRFGAAASALCVLHCAAVPLVFLFVPTLALSLRSWSDPHHGLALALLATLRWERAVVAAVLVFAGFVLAVGYRRHGQVSASLSGIVGAVLLIMAAVGGLDQPLWAHTMLMVSGGALLSCAHVINLRAGMIK